MNQLKPHPFEAEVDRVILDIGGDLAAIKQVFDSGIMYNFIFNGVTAYISLPTYVSTNPDNLFRLEFTIGNVGFEDVGKILITIALDMDMHRHLSLRAIPRTKDNRIYEIILQTVGAVDLVRDGFAASATITGLELAEFYQTEFLRGQRKVS